VKRLTAHQGLAAGASGATILLTAAAFWLSYEHLHDVALANGLSGARAWAWPGTVDLFIVVGELLLLRALLAARGADWWAIALTASGSLGSIALNVAGVGEHAAPLQYVVAAVPPVAALLAFGALMRQVHERLAAHADPVAVPVDAVDAQPVSAADASPDLEEAKAAVVVPPPVPAVQPASAPAVRRPRQTPGAAKLARPVRTDAELLTHLQELRTAATEQLSQRAVLTALGIGVPRLRALLDAHGLTLEPLPAPRQLHAVDTAQPVLAAAGGGAR